MEMLWAMAEHVQLQSVQTGQRVVREGYDADRPVPDTCRPWIPMLTRVKLLSTSTSAFLRDVEGMRC